MKPPHDWHNTTMTKTATKNTVSTLTPGQKAEALVRDLVNAFTREPKHLRIATADRGGTILMSLQTDADDHPRIVGTQGKHIWALLFITALMGRKTGQRINLTLLEPWGGKRLPVLPFIPDPNWKPDRTLALAERVIEAAMPCGCSLEPVNVGELTTLELKPDEWSPEIEGLGKAMHLLFHAAGKAQGRTIHVTMLPPNGPANP